MTHKNFSRKRLALFTAGYLALQDPVGLLARTRKGDRYLAQGRTAEIGKDYDQALLLYEQALSEDPADSGYQLAMRRVRFQTSQAHVDRGLKFRIDGKLTEAQAEFEKAYAIDPSSSVAAQELRRTRTMIERERKKAAQSEESTQEEKGLTPTQVSQKEAEDRFNRMQTLPELKPLSTQPITLKMNNQPARVLFETVGKLAGINVIFDPEFQTTGGARNQSVEFNGSTLEEALEYLAVMTKSFWKPLSPNTIFVTNESTPKRREYEEQVMQVFYLNNITKAQELQEVATNVRTVADIRKLFTYNAQNAIIVKAEADRVALAEKLIADLDKPKPEVVIDVLLMQTTRDRSRDLAAAFAPNGLNIPITYNPRQTIRASTGTSTGGSTDTTGTGLGTTTTTPITSSQPVIPLSNIGRIATGDYAVTLPGGLVEAVMSDGNAKILQSPQVRVLDGEKAILHVGDKVPTATGSFQPGIGGVGINPLVNTQFQFIETGLKIEITPKVHGSDEVSLHVEAEISSVKSRIDLGGISQPIIGQSKITHDVRAKQGEVNLIGGLMQTQENKTVTGVPGLSSIPILRRLFTSESVQKSESELLIVLIPHVVRSPEITATNLKGIAVGNETNVKLTYTPRKQATPEAAKDNKPVVKITPAGPAAVTQPQATAPGQPAPPATAPPATAPPPNPTVPPIAAPVGNTQVTFAPAQAEGQLGGAISVTMLVENAADLTAAPVRIKFDPTILRLNDITPGNLLPNVAAKNILNDSGDATFNLMRVPGAQAPPPLSGALVTLVFQAVGRGSTTVSLPQFSLMNSQSQPIPSNPPALTVTVR